MWKFPNKHYHSRVGHLRFAAIVFGVVGISMFADSVLPGSEWPIQHANAQETESVVGMAPSREGGYGLGRTATEEEIEAWDIDIRPDGAGLPEGSGDVFTGEEIWIEKCASCHGDFGEAIDRWPVIAGGLDSLDSEDPVKTVGSYWPYLSTAWDYIHRAMPFGDAQTLTNDETYALVAYVLYSNDIVDDDFVLSKETFLDVKMPNVEGFYMDDRAETEIELFSREPCMENCKESVAITARARIIDVTPDEIEGESGESSESESETASLIDETPAEKESDAVNEELAKAGAVVYKKCKACHQVGEGAKNRVGPHLNGIFGRKAGMVEGFKYSKVMAKAGEDGFVWDEQSLSDYLKNPGKFMKGTKMAFAGLRKEKDIKAVLEYLESETN